MAAALDAAGIGPVDTVLDVGGHPGLLAAALEDRCRVTTVDFPATGRAPYVRGSGDSLPFRSESFAAVVASDTLEHVPPPFRKRFLEEMARVARRVVLVGGPYATEGVAHAEARLREQEALVRAVPDRWLAEHAEHGLPRLGETWQTLEACGARVAALPNGDLLHWFLLFAGRVALEDLPGGTEAFDAFMPDYNRLLSLPPGEGRAATYRHLVIAVKEGDQAESALGMGGLVTRLEDVSEGGSSGEDGIIRRIDALAMLLQSLTAALRKQAASAQAGGALQAAYVDQLERALAQQNERLQQLSRRGTGGRSSFLSRIIGKLRGGADSR